MRESKILKILSYILIPILILIISISFFYEIEKKDFSEIYNKNFFEGDWFLSVYMNRLSSQCIELIHSNDSFSSIQDGEYKICYDDGYSYDRYNIKDFYYIIIYKNLALTNVELTTETNSVEKIKNYIEKQDSKKANFINGEVFADSELISNKAIQYFENFEDRYYTLVPNTSIEVQEIPSQYEGEEYDYSLKDREYHDVYIQDYQIFTSYKEELIERKSDIFFKNLINDLGKYEKVYIYALPISSVLLISILIYLIIAIGHNKGKEGIDLNDFDKIPIEIILIVIGVILLIIYSLTYTINMLEDYKSIISILLSVYIISYILIISPIVTIIKRIKAKKFIDTSYTCKFCRWAYRKIKKVFKILKIVYGNLKNSWPITAKFIVFVLVSGIIGIGVILVFGPIGIAIDLGIIIYLAYELLNKIICYKKIEKHLKEMYDGTHPQKLNEKDFDKNFKDIINYINDISRGFENAIEEGIKSERLKTELITNVSHDIKTPLTSIINYVDLLKKEELNNEKAKEYVEILDNKSQRLKKLTEDLVEASKASSGNVKLNIEKININELIKQSTGEFEDKFKQKNLEIILSVPKEVIYINADNRYMYRIIENLFSNISKYALDSSRVYIDVKKEFNKVKMDVKNISKEKLNISADELMQRFVRGDKSRNTEGSGLGISISKSLTEIQNGVFDLQIDGDLFKVHLEFNIIN